MLRTRACDDPKPANYGNDCYGTPIEVKECNMHKCEGKYSHRSFFYLPTYLLSVHNMRPSMGGFGVGGGYGMGNFFGRPKPQPQPKPSMYCTVSVIRGANTKSQ